MKTLKFAMPLIFQTIVIAALIAGLTFIFSSCNKISNSTLPTSSSNSLNDENAKTTPISKLNTSLLAGTWHVTYSFDKKVKTSKFTGYDFVFASTGAVDITGPSTLTGTWSTNISKTKFKLSLGTSKPFSELNDDWAIISQTATKLMLTHVSGGGGGISYLTFEQ